MIDSVAPKVLLLGKSSCTGWVKGQSPSLKDTYQCLQRRTSLTLSRFDGLGRLDNLSDMGGR